MKENHYSFAVEKSVPSVSRRRFITQTALAAAGIGILGSPRRAQSAVNNTPIRAIAYNVLECKGWPSDGEKALKVAEKGQIAQRFALELSRSEERRVGKECRGGWNGWAVWKENTAGRTRVAEACT